MSYILGTTTLSTTGSKTVALGFQPTWAVLTVCAKTSTDNVAHKSEGKAWGTFQYCESFFSDTTGSASFNSNAFVVQHYERVSGTVTKVLSASFTSFSATGITLNVDIANTNYQVLIEAGT